MTKTILIKSRDRTLAPNGTSSNFYIHSNDVLEGLYEVKHILIPNTSYNITERNNKFVLNTTNPVGSFLTEIRVGAYTADRLATIMEAFLNAHGAQTFATQMSIISGKMTITCTSGDNFTLTFPDIFTSRVFGFGELLQTAPATFIQSLTVISLGHPDSLGIEIKQLHCSSSAYENVVTRSSGALYVPFNATFGYYVALPSQELYQTVHFHRSNGLNISIVDTSTNHIIELNGGEWEMLLAKVESDSAYHKHAPLPQI